MTALLLLAENLLFPFGALYIVARFLFSPRRAALSPLWTELPERFGRGAKAAERPVWVHCASVGEVNAAAALIGRLAERGLPVLVTTTTAAGRERAAGVPGVTAARFAPLDFGPAVGAFLGRERPRALLVVENELWPQMLAKAQRAGVPVGLVNARMSARSFGRFSLLASALRPLLSRVRVVAAQTEDDAARFRALGAGAVEVAGNMKHDLPGAGTVPAETRAAFAALGWGEAPVFCAGSTHPVEEQAVVDAFLAARKDAPALKLVVAPRHLERAGDAENTLAAAGLSVVRWSARKAGGDALLLDARGVLAGLYGLCSMAFVGGTLAPIGGHNLLEPALAGVPVLFGPHTKAQAESARLLESAGAGFCAEDGARLAALLRDMLKDPARRRAQGALALKTARSLQGAVDRAERLIAPLLA